MKKCLFCLILILAIGQQAYSQKNVEQFLNEISTAEGVEKVKIGRFMMTLVKLTGDINKIPGVKGIHSLEVLTLDDCSQDLRHEFSEQLTVMEDGTAYETLMRVQDEDDFVRIVAKRGKDVIEELVFFCLDKDDSTVLRFKGKIQESELANLTGQYNKKK